MADDAAAPEGELTESTGHELTGSPEESSESPKEAASTKADSSDDVAVDGVLEEDEAEAFEAEEPGPDREPMSHVTLATLVSVVLIVALAALVGWLGWRTYESHTADKQRELFLQVGRQAAINLTTIDFAQADKDVQRILDSATDTFYDDFSKRSQPFVDVVKQAQSKSVGEVTSAGLESEQGDAGQVLVAVRVNTSNAGAPEQAPRAWRMRIAVKKVGPDEAKVSNVEFVP
jgi:Mce-associated membrane protein